MPPVLLSSILVHVMYEQVVCSPARPEPPRTMDVLHSALPYVQSSVLYGRRT